jgi:hypothetical protein
MPAIHRSFCGDYIPLEGFPPCPDWAIDEAEAALGETEDEAVEYFEQVKHKRRRERRAVQASAGSFGLLRGVGSDQLGVLFQYRYSLS